MSEQIKDFVDKLKVEGEHLVNVVFPQKVKELQTIHDGLNLSKLSEVYCDLNVPAPSAVAKEHDSVFKGNDAVVNDTVTNSNDAVINGTVTNGNDTVINGTVTSGNDAAASGNEDAKDQKKHPDKDFASKSTHPGDSKTKSEDDIITVTRTVSKKTKSSDGRAYTYERESRCVSRGSVPINQYLLDISEQLKPYLRDLIDHAATVGIWISLLIPKIEDGNNFGVDVQEEVLKAASSMKDDARRNLQDNTEYLDTRGNLVAKVIKYPEIEDYRRTVRDYDELEFMRLRHVAAVLRNSYAKLHDLITKNLEKIVKPKDDKTGTHYYD